jgi:acyl carrier protein
MIDLTEEVCKVVTDTLIVSKSVDALKSPITADSNMDTIAEWDSLAFVDVFLTVSEHFHIDVDQDDAIQFISIEGIVELIEEIRD